LFFPSQAIHLLPNIVYIDPHNNPNNSISALLYVAFNEIANNPLEIPGKWGEGGKSL